MMPGIRQWICSLTLLAVLMPAGAAEFRSVADNAAVLYDAPSVRAGKRYVIGHSYPLEVIVVVAGWTKVRDASGELTWIESKALSERRTVMVKTRLADIHQAADDRAPLAFQAEQNVLLDLVELTGSGWARVAHRDGQSGYIKLSQILGI